MKVPVLTVLQKIKQLEKSAKELRIQIYQKLSELQKEEAAIRKFKTQVEESTDDERNFLLF